MEYPKVSKKRLILLTLSILLTASSCRPMIRNYIRQKRERELAGGGFGETFTPYYDTKTVVTIAGKVTKVETFVATLMRVEAVRVFVQTENRTYEVHLGPVWYIKKQTFSLKPGDAVTVTGSLIDDKIMVQQFERGGQSFLLRSKEGEPKWFKSMLEDVPEGRQISP